MQRGSALITILLISLLVILVGFFYHSNQKSLQRPISSATNIKSNLNIYTSQQLGFEFKYPKDFSVKQDSEEEFNQRAAGSASKSVNGDFRKNFKGYVGYEPGKFLGAVVLLEKNNSFDKNPFTVWVFDNQDELSIEKWYDRYWYYPFVWGDFTYNGKSKLAPKDEATVSGQLAKSGIVDYQPGKPKFIYLVKDKKMYLFRIIDETGEQIVSSVKML